VKLAEAADDPVEIPGADDFAVQARRVDEVLEAQLELRDVARDHVRVQPDLGGSHHEVFGTEVTAQGGEDLTERVPAAFRVAFGTEESGDLVATQPARASGREYGKERERPASGRYGRSGVRGLEHQSAEYA
jgi:hypothetical protein